MCGSLRCRYQHSWTGNCKLDLTRRRPPNDAACADEEEGEDMPLEKCTWKRSESLCPDTYWDASCGESFILTDGTPKENSMNYCPFCGGELIEAEDEEE